MFGPLIIGYLFLGGLSGGLCVVTAISGLTIPAAQMRGGLAPQQRHIMTCAFVACVGGLVLSALLLLADSGNVLAMKYLFISARPNYLAIGAWLIFAGMVISFAQAVLWRGPLAAWHIWLARTLLAIEAMIGVAIVLYTGLFLSSMSAVPLWHTPWLVALFAASSFSCAGAAFAALMYLSGFATTFISWLNALLKADILFLCAEAVCGAAFIGAAFCLGVGASIEQVAQASANRLLVGDIAPVWWLGFVGTGIAAPLAAEGAVLRRQRAGSPMLEATTSLPLALAVCACIGGLSMRYCVVMAGMHPTLSF